MSAAITGWVLDHSPTVGAARLVLIVLADHANNDGSNAWPSVSTIARQANCSMSTAHRVLRELEAGGQIAREGTSQALTVRYRVVATPPIIGPLRSCTRNPSDHRTRTNNRTNNAYERTLK